MNHRAATMGEPLAHVWAEDGLVHIKIDYGEFVIESSGSFTTEEDAQAAVDLAIEVLHEFTKASLAALAMTEPASRLN